MFARGSGPWLAVPVLVLVAQLGLLIGLGWALGTSPSTAVMIVVAVPLLALQVLFLFFFRDPTRVIGPGIVSPADGVVREVQQRQGQWFVSIFMNVHDVHVNRLPMAGTITSITHHRGGHRPAFADDAARNEHQVFAIATDHGTMTMTQIAGLVARRCVSYVEVGQRLDKGTRVGMIRFSSRVDVLVPAAPGLRLAVAVGDRVRAGSSTLLSDRGEGPAADG